MQKYKVVASKSQKKYTLILSADSESHAKEKLHKDGYSILSIDLAGDHKVSGNKFIFQVQKDGDIKNGVIIGHDIFKVYIKLREELGYNVISIYPEGDEAHNNAEKKQRIIKELESGYEIQQKKIKIKQEEKQSEESFYLKKQLDQTYILINQAIKKFDGIFNNRKDYNISDETFYKLEKVYEKLIHIKSSTNLVKLKKIWELALMKIWEIELQSLEENKNKKSRELLNETNTLLKKIGSTNHFIEEDKDIKKKISSFFTELSKAFSSLKLERKAHEKKEILDKDSYSFLKTILLLEKYKEKLSENSGEIKKNIILFINPFSSSQEKEKIMLKRKVIQQNISILKAKKKWWVWSYTGVKKGASKILETLLSGIHFLAKGTFIAIFIYILLFLFILIGNKLDIFILTINAQSIVTMLLFFVLFFVLHFSKNIFIFFTGVVFFSFIFIFSMVNF